MMCTPFTCTSLDYVSKPQPTYASKRLKPNIHRRIHPSIRACMRYTQQAPSGLPAIHERRLLFIGTFLPLSGPYGMEEQCVVVHDKTGKR